MLEEWVSRVTYRPGWWLKVTESAAGIELHVGYTGPSSVLGEPERPVSHKRELAFPMSFERFVREAIVTFQELENHETREWFRVDGEHWPGFVPHDPKAVMTPLQAGRMRTTGAIYDPLGENNGEQATN